ncbi:hypothetical protein HD806DRAFT_525159 [Xylariaceae sp. AK1471]|nr:hypothetical protein HD806DRAFT_525159 [Xylariaceae sp. AK1471]
MQTSRDTSATRKRRTHKKSRHGCANCKLRSIKCDETKPSCKKCNSFSVICSYGSKFSPENLSISTRATGSFQVHLDTATPTLPVSLPAPLPVSGSGLEIYQLVAEDIPLLERFQNQTVWTLGTAASHYIYAEKILPLAFSNSLLMHVILAMSAVHSLALIPFSSPIAATQPPRPAFHCYHSISLLQRKLTRPILPSERDVLWISASLISLCYLAHVETSSPWPLRPPSAADISWLKLCDGQRLLAILTNPTRADCAFRLPAMEMVDAIEWVRGLVKGDERDQEMLHLLPRGFDEVFGLSASFASSSSLSSTGSPNVCNNDDEDRNNDGGDAILSTPKHENPYYATAIASATMLRRELSDENFLVHICFIRIFDSRFRDLLLHRDKKAMLLLLYWYAKICDRRLVWLWKRAWTEGLAICSYLEKAWGDEGSRAELGLLEWPRKRLMAAAGEL